MRGEREAVDKMAGGMVAAAVGEERAGTRTQRRGRGQDTGGGAQVEEEEGGVAWEKGERVETA